jgi:hypothetical protein
MSQLSLFYYSRPRAYLLTAKLSTSMAEPVRGSKWAADAFIDRNPSVASS